MFDVEMKNLSMTNTMMTCSFYIEGLTDEKWVILPDRLTKVLKKYH
jgi:hypothetical protein